MKVYVGGSGWLGGLMASSLLLSHGSSNTSSAARVHVLEDGCHSICWVHIPAEVGVEWDGGGGGEVCAKAS